MTLIRYILIVGLLWCSLLAGAQVTIEQKVDSVSILIGEQAHLTVAVTAPAKAKVAFPAMKPSTYLVPGVELLKVEDGDTVAMDNNLMMVSKKLTITSFDEHLYAIPGMKVKVDGRLYTANTSALKVLTVDVDTLHPNQFYPPQDVQNNPFEWKEWSGLFWMSLLMLVLCAIGFYLFVRLKENKPVLVRVHIVKHIPPHQKALNAIAKIKEERLVSSEDQKTYYTLLTDTLRRYIEERFGFSAMEMTSSEIISHLQQVGDRKMIDELKELFQTADLVKFAKYSTLINENDLNLVNAVTFIDETKTDAAPTEERIVPQLTENEAKTRKARYAAKMSLYAIGLAVVAIIIYVVYHAYQLLA